MNPLMAVRDLCDGALMPLLADLPTWRVQERPAVLGVSIRPDAHGVPMVTVDVTTEAFHEVREERMKSTGTWPRIGIETAEDAPAFLELFTEHKGIVLRARRRQVLFTVHVEHNGDGLSGSLTLSSPNGRVDLLDEFERAAPHEVRVRCAAHAIGILHAMGVGLPNTPGSLTTVVEAVVSLGLFGEVGLRECLYEVREVDVLDAVQAVQRSWRSLRDRRACRPNGAAEAGAAL